MLVQTTADDLRNQLTALNLSIAADEALLERREKTLNDLRAHIDNQHTKRRDLEMKIAREEAKLVKRQPVDVKAGPFSI